MPDLLCRVLVSLLLIVFTTVSAEAQRTREGTASISGRVTVEGKGARGVILTLSESSKNERRTLQSFLEGGSLEKASTDDEGRYRFQGIAGGRYEIVPYAPAHILTDQKNSAITIADGETVDDIDFTLSRGGAITGRVTGVDGRPLMMVLVQVARTEKTASPNAASPFGGAIFQTDDRGIYRIYGLAPGSYKVSTSIGAGGFDLAGLLLKRPDHPQTFHPGVTDETRAAIVEVAAGGETANVDIKIGVAKKTYKATGRVIDIATGKPLANAITSYVAADGGESAAPRMAGLGSPSSATGEFRLEGLMPGRYKAYALFGIEAPSEYYSDTLNFEVKNEDVIGLDIKVHRGGSISGVAVVEGENTPALLEKVSPEIFAMVMAQDGAPNFARSKIAEDGSFQLRGLRSGNVRIMLQDLLSQSGLSLVRIEREGVALPAGIDLGAGEHLTDVRLILASASGVIRGQVRIEGGTLPRGAEVSVVARRKDTSINPDQGGGDSEEADVDAAGRFMIEGLLPGEYEVSVTAVLNPDVAAKLREVRIAREHVSVTGGSGAEVVLVLDLRKRSEKN